MNRLAALQTPIQAHDVFAEVDGLYQEVLSRARARYASWSPRFGRPTFLPSAHNLAAYLAFREHDLRDVQERLVPLGLSSLGRCESHVIPTLKAVRATLAALCGVVDAAAERPFLRDFALGERLLRRNTKAVFGPWPGRSHIMVTLPADAAGDPETLGRLIEAGMDCARINCAHDEPAAWRALAAGVRAAAAAKRRACTVYMDLAGPKIRTAGPLAHDPSRRFLTGDRFVLAKHPRGGDAKLPTIVCTEPAVFEVLRTGAPVWVNDGKLGGIVVETWPDGAVIEVTHASVKGNKIGADKGLNFPSTCIPIPALSEKDLADLDEIVVLADVVGQSFVRGGDDVEALLQQLAARSKRLAIVAKIETAQAIRNLPEIVVAGAGMVPFGVMIARGDLAVEIGYQRLAEIQEELLWLCESAHVPVVWATQVLDGFVRKGLVSRAEITDAAMAERAECVMLNKGPFVVEAVGTLADVLERMQAHQSKKTARLRALRSWTGDTAGDDAVPNA